MSVVVPLAVSDILEVVADNHCEGQSGLNVTFWEVVALAGTGSDMETALLTIADLVGPLYQAWMSTLADFRGVYGRRIWPLPATYTTPLVGTALVGVLAGKLVPTQCRGLITRFNSLGGPKNRARMYVPFGTADNLTSDGGVSAGGRTLMDALASAYSVPLVAGTPPNTATVVPRMLTRSAVPLSSGLHAVGSWFTSTNWATQKSSGQFGRPNP